MTERLADGGARDALNWPIHLFSARTVSLLTGDSLPYVGAKRIDL